MMDVRTRDIVDVAFGLFKLKGYDQVSTLDICRSCGITKPTFYKYISSKDNILATRFKVKEEFILPDVKALYQSGQLLPALYRGLAYNHEVTQEIGPELMVKYVNSLLMQPSSNYRFDNEMNGLMVQILQDLIDSHVIEGWDNPQELYYMLCQLDQGLILRWTAAQGSFGLDHEFVVALCQVLNLKDSSALMPHGIMN